MNIIKNSLKLIKAKISLFFGLFLKKDLTIRVLSYIAIISFAIAAYIISPIIDNINIWFIRFIISFLAICFYVRHIYLMWKFYPPKSERKKHKRSFSDRILLKNHRPLDKRDGIKIIIAADLFAIAVFIGYFS
ncbi:hypothetical protein N8772_02405 [Rickettsiales bacterium]|nr:hypothetical protein [Rickettsiales bacterium]